MNLSRELYRKERAKAEVNRMVQRYDSECGKVHTYKVDPEILKDYYPGSELPGSKIEAGNDTLKFTDGEPLTAEDVAFTYNTLKKTSSVNDFTMLECRIGKRCVQYLF